MQINYLRGEELNKIHLKIKEEYELSVLKSKGKGKGKILSELALKYGYSSSQSIRNILNGNSKK